MKKQIIEGFIKKLGLFSPPSDDIYVLMTNASRSQHWQDIINVICYPIGWKITFAYEDEWIKGGCDPKANNDALIVFYDPLVQIGGVWQDMSVNALKGIDRKEDFKFFPIRQAQIGSVNHESGACIIELTLGSFIEYRKRLNVNAGDNLITALVAEIIKRASNECPKPYKPILSPIDDETTKLVYRFDKGSLGFKNYLPDMENKNKSGEHLWIRMAQYLIANSQSLKFTNLVCLFSESDTDQPQIPYTLRKGLSQTKRDIGDIVVMAGSSHEISATVLKGDHCCEIMPTFQIDKTDKGVSIGNPISKQRGPGVDLVWRILFSDLSARQSGFLYLNTSHAGRDLSGFSNYDESFKNRVKDINGPKMYLSWNIRPNSWEIAFNLALVLVGIYIISSSSNLVDLFSRGAPIIYRNLLFRILLRGIGGVVLILGSVRLLKIGISKVLGI